jgi:peptide deformylase
LRRNTVRLGHPILRFPAATVEIESLQAGDYNDLLNDLRDTLESSGASAVTAPQLGVELQIVAIRATLLDEAASDSGVEIVVNPMLEPEHGEPVYDWEGCLSIPGLKGLVPRYPVIRMRGLDHVGEPFDLQATGEAARVLQHAHDHLSGVVFLDRMGDMRSLAFQDEWRQFLSAAADGEAGGESGE